MLYYKYSVVQYTNGYSRVCHNLYLSVSKTQGEYGEEKKRRRRSSARPQKNANDERKIYIGRHTRRNAVRRNGR